jgi:hypothetical protein
MAHPTGFEPVIPGFVDRCLIQFGHGCRARHYLEERVSSQDISDNGLHERIFRAWAIAKNKVLIIILRSY